MYQVYGWPDGKIWLWTGGAGATSATAEYASDSQARFMHGAENIQNISGVYRDVPTGRRVDVTIGALYSLDWRPVLLMASAETAVHMHFAQNDKLTSAGHFLWSGFIDSVEIVGRERGLYQLRFAYHANRWSAY